MLIPHKRFLKSNYSKIMAFSAPNMGDWTKAWHVVANGCNTDISMSTEYGVPNSTLIELIELVSLSPSQIQCTHHTCLVYHRTRYSKKFVNCVREFEYLLNMVPGDVFNFTPESYTHRHVRHGTVIRYHYSN
jgi:hypothetical protein